MRGSCHNVPGVTFKGAVRRLVPRQARNWLRSPRRSLRWLSDEVSHALGRHSELALFPGWSLRCHPAAARTAFTPLIADPEQRREMEAFIAECRPGMKLLDVGAHFGLFSLAALHYGGPEAAAVAVDPSAGATRMIRINATLNGFGRRLTVVTAAAAEQSGTLGLVPVGVIAAGYFVRPDSREAPSETVAVPAFSIDDLCAQLPFSPTHIKIDVEGYEAEVLNGASRTLALRPAPVLFIELHNGMVRARGASPQHTLDLLQAKGYVRLERERHPIAADRVLADDVVRLIARAAA